MEEGKTKVCTGGWIVTRTTEEEFYVADGLWISQVFELEPWGAGSGDLVVRPFLRSPRSRRSASV